MNQEQKTALNAYRKAKRLLEVERQSLLDLLPEKAASSFHYNGRHAKEEFPEYAKIFDCLLEE